MTEITTTGLSARIDAVLELHQEHVCGDGPCVDKGKCRECGFEYPCETRRLLDGPEPGLTDRQREVFVKLIQFVDREHWYDTDACHPVRGDDCSPYCGACEVLRHVDDQILREAREASDHAR